MVVFDNYDVKIGVLYYYAIHNTMENKITCFEYYRYLAILHSQSNTYKNTWRQKIIFCL